MDVSPGSLNLMQALAEAGPPGLSREQLMQRAAVSYASFYRGLRPLLEARLVTVDAGRRYVMPLDNLYNFRLKLWHDVERLYRLEPVDCSNVLKIVNQARTELGDNLRCLWLVGSGSQATLTEKSDLDFLAVVRKDRLYSPSGLRPINFVMMTEAAFGRKYLEGDEFIQEAICHGILLLDLGFAQDFYAQPLHVGVLPQVVAEREDSLEAQREKLSFFLQADEIEEARKALLSVAVGTSRLLLRQFGESPGSKADLLRHCELLFGPGLTETLAPILEREPLSKAKIVQLNRRLANTYEAVMQHASHLKSVASLPAANEMDLRAAAVPLLSELLPGAKAVEDWSEKTGVKADLVLRREHRHYVFLFKSFVRGLTAFHVKQFADALGVQGGRRGVQPVLVVNTYRDVPVVERRESVAARVRAKELGIRILTGLDLLRAHNVLHLEGDIREPSQIFS